MISYCSEYSYY